MSFFLSQIVMAQDFSIKRVEMSGDKLNLYYDLLDSVSERTYTIKVFSSKDNFVSPLEKVSGDLGLEVKAGSNRKITWDAKQELGGDFSGKVSLEIRGRIYIPFVRLNGSHQKIKRDMPYEITWTGGTEQNILNFDLYRDEQKITSFPNIANVGHHAFTLPTSVKPGKGYSFRITDSKNQDQIVNTKQFIVKRKVPLLLKVVPLVAIGVVIAALPKPTPEDTSVPKAPDHP